MTWVDLHSASIRHNGSIFLHWTVILMDYNRILIWLAYKKLWDCISCQNEPFANFTTILVYLLDHRILFAPLRGAEIWNFRNIWIYSGRVWRTFPEKEGDFKFKNAVNAWFGDLVWFIMNWLLFWSLPTLHYAFHGSEYHWLFMQLFIWKMMEMLFLYRNADAYSTVTRMMLRYFGGVICIWNVMRTEIFSGALLFNSEWLIIASRFAELTEQSWRLLIPEALHQA